MRKALIKTLADAIQREKDGLRGNSFALRLTDYLIKHGIPDNTRLQKLVYKEDEIKDLPILDDNISGDGRICKLLLAHVRQYSPSDKFDYYTLDFSERGHPVSSIFHGANGSGKSTIFASMEYLYLKKSEYATAHGHPNNQSNFFKSVISPETEPIIFPLMEDIVVSTASELNGFEIPAAFCSECDYFEITRNWDKLNDYISRQLGYEDFHDLLKRLKSLSTKLELSKKYVESSHLLISLNNKFFYEKDTLVRDNLNKDIEQQKIKMVSFQRDFNEIEFSELDRGIEKLAVNDKSELIETNAIEEIKSVYRVLESEWKNVLSDFKVVADSIFDKMMKDSLLTDKESLEITLKESVIKPNLVILKESYEEGTSSVIKHPVEYFNTFRLKLFCMAFKMSLYCCAKIKQQTNLPFVVDDIFDSSDFANRSKIGRVVHKMIESHDLIMKECNLDFPLQFIFFTQDNIIGENIYNGLRNYAYETGKDENIFVKSSRLFRPEVIIIPATSKESQ